MNSFCFLFDMSKCSKPRLGKGIFRLGLQFSNQAEVRLSKGPISDVPKKRRNSELHSQALITELSLFRHIWHSFCTRSPQTASIYNCSVKKKLLETPIATICYLVNQFTLINFYLGIPASWAGYLAQQVSSCRNLCIAKIA